MLGLVSLNGFLVGEGEELAIECKMIVVGCLIAAVWNQSLKVMQLEKD